ncbi:MAG: hypothetical protein HRU70_06995 [Phycisphaeraceae bacterium]|nr:MAG: hypothetical protein HRU70_06995 [Phycisphaeraceae bacterium]
MRTITIVAMACCAAWYVLAGAAQPLEMESFVRDLRSAYRMTVPIEFEMESFSIPLDEPIPIDSSRAETLIRGASPINPRVIRAHPDGWLMSDVTHPSQRHLGRTPFGTLSYGGFIVQVMDAGRLKGRSWSRRYAAGIAGELFIGTLPTLVEELVAEDPAATLQRRDDGWVFQAKNHRLRFAGDFTLHEWREDSPDGTVETRRVLRDGTTPFLRARVPIMLHHEHRTNDDRVLISVIHTRALPRESTGLTEDRFRWWTYADEMLDERTGTLYGPGNVEIDPAAAEPVRPASNPADLAMFVDERSLEAHAKDPSALVLPKRKWTPQPYLLVGGITLIVLGLAWALRRRFAA